MVARHRALGNVHEAAGDSGKYLVCRLARVATYRQQQEHCIRVQEASLGQCGCTIRMGGRSARQGRGDYAKVNKTLFVEAWQVRERRKLCSPHELSTFVSRPVGTGATV